MAYAPCIAHGINMTKSQEEEKRAVEAGYWPLYRYNPAEEKSFAWETKEPTADYIEFIKGERRYSALKKTAPQDAEKLYQLAAEDAKRRMAFFKNLGDVM
jgi:pyruvate-ferredoxin/flavodoxin oxidoreductase